MTASVKSASASRDGPVQLATARFALLDIQYFRNFMSLVVL